MNQMRFSDLKSDEVNEKKEAETPEEILSFPCSSSQERCWFINALNPGTTALNIALRWDIKGCFTPDLVERAFQQVIDRHEILRSRFIEKDGELVQEVSPHVDFKLTVIDLSVHPEEKRDEEALAFGNREAHVPFDLEHFSLIRATLLMLSPTHGIILVAMHQIVFDGSSIRILANDFGMIAAALEAGRTPDLPDLPLQYGDFCLWQKEYYASEGFDAEARFWKQQLAGMTYFEVRPDYPRPPLPTHRGEILAAMLPHDLGTKVEDTAKHYNVTLFSLGCAVIAAALHRYTGRNDVIFSTQIANRDEPELENMIGIFINNIVMRLDASGDPTFREFVGNVAKTVQHALIHRRMPFHKLVELVNPPRDPSRLPLVSISFTVLHDVMEHKHYGNFDLLGLPSLAVGSVYDLNFFMVHWPNGWRMAMEYNPDLFDRSTAEGLLDFLVKTFESIICHPQDRLSALIPPMRESAQTLSDADQSFSDLISTVIHHSDIADAIIAPQLLSSGKPVANLFVVPASGTNTPLETLPGKLMTYLAQTLPQDELPGHISVLLSLPRKANGSVDLAALPTPASPASVPTKPVVPQEDRLSPVEAKLASIWEDVLKVQDVKPDSNFFELGGHSLLAVRLMVQVAKVFGTKLDIVTLFQSPTLREFASHLSLPDQATDHWAIVSIQPEGDKIPIITINNAIRFYNLARMMGTDRPMIGVQLEDMAGAKPVAGRSVQDIASDYIEPIRAVRPHGPYILSGWCVSGSIAYEVAHQLRQSGESVPLVILVDNWIPRHLRFLPRCLYSLEYKLNYILQDFRRIWRGQANISKVLSGYRRLRKSGLLNLAAALRIIPPLPPEPTDEVEKQIEDNYLSFYPYMTKARLFYVPPDTNDRVVIMQSDELANLFPEDPKMGWGAHCKGGLDVLRVPGLHVELLFDEGAKLIADYLRPVLDEIDHQCEPEQVGEGHKKSN
ncbi:condensation domain-containing protein [Beijerinckia mobilis]|uniref:condensation domain-containing protein n=1 Tax=Beijerinckia mobilis TaxID=231434 RepID=UPI00068B8D76|nr:condensation domain-containing protein [Beijerinckia mobilis]